MAAMRAIRDAKGQKSEKAVLVMLVSRSNRLGLSYPTVARLASDVGTSERDVQRSLRRLKFAKLVEVMPTPRRANVYRLTVENLQNRRLWMRLELALDAERHGESFDGPPDESPGAPPAEEPHVAGTDPFEHL